MSVPIEVHKNGIETVGGQSQVLELDVPARGTIKKIVCAQRDGTLEGFSFNIYNAAAPVADLLDTYYGSSNSSSSSSGDGATPSDAIYKAVPTQSAGSGEALAEMWAHNEQEYHNKDTDKTSDLKRKLYLKLHPEGSGAKTFDFAILVVGQNW